MEAMKARDGARSIANPQLLGELRNRVAEDQAARRAWLRSGGSGRDVQMIDEKNLKWLRGLIRDSGFPNADQVGEDGVHLAWLLLQHADYDPQFQRSMLPALVERWKHHELPGDDLARLTDRILKASGQPQRFGTQFDWRSATFRLPDHDAVNEIDKNRALLGLMPIADYACMMQTAAERIRK